MSLDKYDIKFQKYLLGEALKGKTALRDTLDPKTDETVWLSDGKVIKGIHKDDSYILLERFNLASLIYRTYSDIEEIPEPYNYCKLQGIKNLCLKVNDSLFIDTKYLGFFDMNKSTLYSTKENIILVTENDRVTGVILGIKDKEME